MKIFWLGLIHWLDVSQIYIIIILKAHFIFCIAVNERKEYHWFIFLSIVFLPIPSNDNLSSAMSEGGSRAETISAKLTLTNYTFGSLMEFWKRSGNGLFNYGPRLTLRPQNYGQEG